MPGTLRRVWIGAFLLVGWIMSLVLGIEPVRANDLKDQELSDLVGRLISILFLFMKCIEFGIGPFTTRTIRPAPD